MFVTWLIVLIAGRMPRPLHEALAAAVRYQVRVSGYFLMLTAQYPGGLFGDPDALVFGTGRRPGSSRPVRVGRRPRESRRRRRGPGSPASTRRRRRPLGWGQPGPQVPGSAQPGSAQPGWGPWGQPAAAQSGVGAARGGAVRVRPAPRRRSPGTASPRRRSQGTASPRRRSPGTGRLATVSPRRDTASLPPGALAGRDQPWRLVLSRPAKRLVTLFLVLGVILLVGYGVLIAVIASSSGNDTVTRAEATISVEAGFARLSSTLSGFDSKVAACQGRLSCVNKVYAQMSGAFGRFAQDMKSISMPSAASAAAADQIRSDASQASDDFMRLSKVASAAQYQQVVATTGLETLLRRFDADYQALGTTLGAR